MADSGKNHDDEVDIFELAGAQPTPVSSEGHIETETNVFFVETLRQAAAQRGGVDSGAFEVSAPAAGDASDGADFDPSASTPGGAGGFEPPAAERPGVNDAGDAAAAADAPLDDDTPRKKGGFFAKLFRRDARGGEGGAEGEDSDELSLDDDMFIAPPQVSGRTSAVAANSQPPAAADEPEIAAAAPEVTDSGIFEFKLPAGEAVPAASDEPEIVATAPEVTDSGVFVFGPPVNTIDSVDSVDNTDNTDNAVSAVSDEAGVEPEIVATAPEVTDSGVFEFGPSINTIDSVDNAVNTDNTDNAVSAVSDEAGNEPEFVATAPEVTDSGVFEFGPSINTIDSIDSVDNTAHAVSAVSDEPPPAGGGRRGDEWEIGWEPQDDGAPAEFDVSGDASAAAATSAGPAGETPPPVFTRLAHVCLYVKDLVQSVEFYAKLGFQKRFVFNRNGSLFGVYLEFGSGNFIELFEDVSRGSAATLGRLAHFCLETPDIDAAMEALSARGIEFTPKKLGCDSTYQIWLKDPDGNEFEIHQYTENSSQIIGGEVEADW